jgi:hypothetical protein
LDFRDICRLVLVRSFVSVGGNPIQIFIFSGHDKTFICSYLRAAKQILVLLPNNTTTLEEIMTTQQKLGKWIEDGMRFKNVTDTRLGTFRLFQENELPSKTSGFVASILDLAFIGKIGDPFEAFKILELDSRPRELTTEEMAKHLSIPLLLAEKVVAVHKCSVPSFYTSVMLQRDLL